VRSAEQLGLGEGTLRLCLWRVARTLFNIEHRCLEANIIAVCEPKSKNGLDLLAVSDPWVDPTFNLLLFTPEWWKLQRFTRLHSLPWKKEVYL
jgi:hypothetical protein